MGSAPAPRSLAAPARCAELIGPFESSRPPGSAPPAEGPHLLREVLFVKDSEAHGRKTKMVAARPPLVATPELQIRLGSRLRTTEKKDL